jgi:hypothetical protein
MSNEKPNAPTRTPVAHEITEGVLIALGTSRRQRRGNPGRDRDVQSRLLQDRASRLRTTRQAAATLGDRRLARQTISVNVVSAHTLGDAP